MEMNKKRLDIGQISLFDVIRQVSEKQKADAIQGDMPGSLNIEATVRELVSLALKHTKLSRYEVAAAMSIRLGKEITKSQIDSWSAESKENHRFPLAYINAFMEATRDKTILRLMCEKAGGYFIEGEDALYTELGRIEKAKEEIAEKERLVRETLARLKKNGGVK